MTPKKWHHHWQDPAGAHLLNENVWFQVNQPMLLRMANTTFGRELLEIPRDYPQIVRMAKNEVTAFIGMKNGRFELLGDYRIGAKWANVIRSRWSEFNSYARYFLNDEKGLVFSPAVRDLRSVAAATLTAYPNAHTETDSVDGYANFTTSSNWASVHDAATGTGADDSGTSMGVSTHIGSAPNYSIDRIFTLYLTSSLTSGASVSSGTVSLWATSKDDAESDNVAPVSSNPASNTAITTADYDQVGTTLFATAINVSAISTAGAYTDWTLNASGLAAISKTGVTKFGFRMGKDISNTAPTNSGNFSYVNFRSADQTGTSNDPKLVLTYTVASFRPLIIIC